MNQPYLRDVVAELRAGAGIAGAAFSDQILIRQPLADDLRKNAPEALAMQAADLPNPWLPYVVITAVFIVFGGLFSTVWQDDNRVKCFYFGVTFPIFVSAMLVSTPKLPP